jgi:hypothetical protein
MYPRDMASKPGKRARRSSERTERDRLLHSLKVHKQLRAPSGKSAPKELASGVTHTIETRPDGTKVLVRKRFSAV